MNSYTAGEFDKQGHRGCRGLMPENTIPAMLNALALGVTTLEMDVVISKDQQVLLSHEPYFNEEITTKPGGSYIIKDDRSYNIYQMDYDSVKTFDVGLKPHPRFPQQQKIKAIKPLLSAVFLSVKEYMMTARRPFPFYNIEIKSQPATDQLYHPAPSTYVDLVMKVVKEYGLEEQVIIQSFDKRALVYLHKKYPAIKTAFLVDAGNKNSFRKQLTDLGFTPGIYSPDYSLVNPNLVKDCHARNIRIIPWTVNDPQKIKELKAMGVDGIITDYPGLLQD